MLRAVQIAEGCETQIKAQSERTIRDISLRHLRRPFCEVIEGAPERSLYSLPIRIITGNGAKRNFRSLYMHLRGKKTVSSDQKKDIN